MVFRGFVFSHCPGHFLSYITMHMYNVNMEAVDSDSQSSAFENPKNAVYVLYMSYMCTHFVCNITIQFQIPDPES